jgi:hypothetical protein
VKRLICLTSLLALLLIGCSYSQYWKRTDAQTISEDQLRKDLKECLFPCYYSSHWRSLNSQIIPVYGYFYNIGYQFSSLKDEEDKAASECFDQCIENRGYVRKGSVDSKGRWTGY